MTSELAAFHGEAIRLEVLKGERHPHCHLREVVLHAATSGTPVEYGVIEILLDAFPATLHADILSGAKPLGTLIVEAKLPFHSEPQGFFTIPAEAIAKIFPQSSGGENLYGRYNHLIRGDGSCLARIIEILPSAS
jgi:chorismate-pyruvate lyase